MQDWMNDPELAQISEQKSDWSGLAQREAPQAIPAHFATSLSELRAQQEAQRAQITAPSKPQRETPTAPIIEPHEIEGLTEQGVALFGRASELLRRIAETGNSVDHSALESLARRLETLRVAPDTTSERQRMLDVARQLREDGLQWKEAADVLNERGYRGHRGQEWQGASLRRAVLRDEQGGDR